MDDIQLIPTEDDDDGPLFNFNHPEDVLIWVYPDPGYGSMDWEGWGLEIHGIAINCDSSCNITGAASYENGYGGFLDYTLMDIVDCPKKEGWYVVAGITGEYHRGDWSWGEDDDMTFDYKGIRPATDQEIKDHGTLDPPSS